ncbi:MAG: wax ester/triacylglycerol synthase family O-acyltransferase [Acidimicrobiales bacterium]
MRTKMVPVGIERVRTQDATIWVVQGEDTPLQIGAVCFFEGAPLHDEDGALRTDALRERVAAHLHLVPRLRQRLVPVPLDLGPVWADDEDFDLDRHLRTATLAAPGGEAELRALVRELLEQPLDDAKPLWEFWLIDGLADGRVVLVPKVSHVMADGMALLEFALSLLDAGPPGEQTPSSAAASAPPAWSPERLPDTVPLVVRTAVERTRSQLGTLAQLAATAADPRRWVGAAGAAVRLASEGRGRAPSMPITAAVGPRRDFVWCRLPWDDLTRVRKAAGGTLNDVVLAVTAGALARYLVERGPAEPDDAAVPRVLVPVSTHGQNAAGEVENRFSMMVADLPLHLDRPLDRLRHVRDEMDRHKASAQRSIGPVLFSVGDLFPAWLLHRVGPAILRNQPFVNLAVTNLPGTREPGYLLGARMLEVYPFVCGIGNIAVIIGVVSYDDALGVGITVDADVVPDVDALADAIEEACAELVGAVPDDGG